MKKKIKIEEKQQFYGLMKIWLNFDHLKSLIRIFLWFWREEFHINIYYFVKHHILSHYREFETKINIEVEPIFEFLLPLS